VGDEGGFAPNCKSNEEAIQIVLEAIGAAGYKPGEQVSIALDPASSEFYDKASGKYVFKKSDKSAHSSAEMAAYWTAWTEKYPVVSIRGRDGRGRLAGWKQLTQSVGSKSSKKKIQLVGDDLFVTNTERLSRGINEGIANAILIKLNQIGTVTETIDAIELARKAGYNSIISHRSGETEDTFIADLAVRHRRADQDWFGFAHGPNCQSTTSCCASRKSWARAQIQRQGSAGITRIPALSRIPYTFHDCFRQFAHVRL